MKTWTLVIVCASAGVIASCSWFLWGRHPGASDALARKAGFSNGRVYQSGLDLIQTVDKTKRLPADKRELFTHIAQREGGSGELMSLVIMLPLPDPDDRQFCLTSAATALADPNNAAMSSSVLRTYEVSTPELVNAFIAGHPKCARLLKDDSPSLTRGSGQP